MQALQWTRSPALLVYALIFTNAVTLTAYVPLVPVFEDEFGLSTLESGALFSALGVSIILVALPLGFGADRIGSRALSVAAGALLVVGALGQALAVDFWSLLGARLIYGTASTTILIAGVAWLTDSVEPQRRARAVGTVMPVAGVGALLGPIFGGALGDALGREAPFLVAAAMAAVVLVGLLLGDPGRSVIHDRQTVRSTAALVRLEHAVLAAAILILIGGLAESVVNTFAPLQLDQNGLSASRIGVILAVAAVCFVVVSAVIVRLAGRATRLRYGPLVAIALAISLLPLVLSATTGAIAAGTIARMAVLGTVYTIGFPLGALGAYRAGIGRGSVYALLMLSSGIGNAVGPLAGAGLVNVSGEAAAYGAVLGACALGAVWIGYMALQRRRSPAT